MIIQNGIVFTKDCTLEEKTITVTEDKITGVGAPACVSGDDCVIDAAGCYVIPGLTDVHFHGCVGYDFCDGTQEAFTKMAAYELKNGITTICPATMTLAEDTLHNICTQAAAFAKEQSDVSGSTLVGINLEGPFLSYAKKGAQNPQYLHQPDAAMLSRLQDAAQGLVKLVAIAPEEEGAMECIKNGDGSYKFSVAHTTAGYDIASEAMKNGAMHVTHLYNAMPPFTHRESGVIGAAFDAEGCEVELICDGVHISPPVVRATFRLFGDDRVILISDSMMATGMEDGKYALGGQPVNVKGNLATLEDGTIAGSATNLMDCMRTAIKMGIPKESAFKAATINPARSIGIDNEYGSIQTGKTANLVLLDQKDLSIKGIIFKGVRL